MRALRTAATGMAAQQLNVETISNNIANMNTVGFKRQRAEFQDLLYQNLSAAGAQSSDAGTVVPTGVQLGSGVKTGSVYRITQQGSLTKTGNKFDVAINGKGYFQVQLPSGETAYTRAGNFSVNDAGPAGHRGRLSGAAADHDPAGRHRRHRSPRPARCRRPSPARPQPQVVGQLQLATFFNEAGLEAIGDNYSCSPAPRGAPNVGKPGRAGFGTLQQGYTEASNVDAVTEITSLIVAQRAYEMNSKVVNAADQMLSTTSQLKS